MKAFLSIALVLVIAGLSDSVPITKLGSKVKEKAKAVVTGIFHKLINTTKICNGNNGAFNCCFQDLIKNNICFQVLVDPASSWGTVSLTINNRTFISKKISEDEMSKAKKTAIRVTDLFGKFAHACAKNQENTRGYICCVKDLLRNNICFGIQPDLSTLSVNVSFTVNDKTIIQKKVSGHNPPKVCLPMPFVETGTVCFRLYDLSFANDTLRVCRSLEANLITKVVTEVDLNCIQINADHIDLVPAETKLKSPALLKVDTAGLIPFVKFVINPIANLAFSSVKNKLVDAFKYVTNAFQHKTTKL